DSILFTYFLITIVATALSFTANVVVLSRSFFDELTGRQFNVWLATAPGALLVTSFATLFGMPTLPSRNSKPEALTPRRPPPSSQRCSGCEDWVYLNH